MPAALPTGTIVTKQARGLRRIQSTAQILEAFTKSDRLGRIQRWYRVRLLDNGSERDWPGSHCQVITPAPDPSQP